MSKRGIVLWAQALAWILLACAIVAAGYLATTLIPSRPQQSVYYAPEG